MGRKIPGKKHRGVNDPEKQAAVRFNSVKDKINAPPLNPDYQQIPKTLLKIIDLRNKVKNGDFTKKRKKKLKNLEGQDNKIEINKQNNKFKGKPEKPIPVFTQKPNETDKKFLHRVSLICQDVVKEAAFENKYGIDINRNESGKVENVVKRPKDELEVLIKKKKREGRDKKLKKKKKQGDQADEPRLTKSQKWQKKKKEKKLKKTIKNHDKTLEKNSLKDEVKFGEMVHAPPTLVAPRKVEKLQSAPRPGMKSLLLKSILDPKNSQVELQPPRNKNDKLNKTLNKPINKKGKRKDLPNALRRQLDNQQKEIIEAYKLLKSNKYNN